MNFLKKICLVLLGLLIAILFIEISLRIYYYVSEKQLIGLKPARSTLEFYENDIFGHALKPNQNAWFVTESKEYANKIKVNSHGWPDNEHSYNKPQDVYRIIFLGDSFVENMQVPLEKRFFRQVENNLNELLDKKIEIIAIGRGNTGTAQQYLILNNFAVKYNPDLVVHMFLTANDVKNNSPSLQNDPYLPYFTINEGELKEIKQIKRSNRVLGGLKELLKKLRIVELFLKLRQNYTEKKQISSTNEYPLDYQVYEENYSQQYQEAWDTTKKLILESKNTLDKKGVKYVLVSLANNEQVHPNLWNKIINIYPDMKQKTFNLEKPDIILKDFCEKENISCFFMLPFFNEFIKKNPTKLTHYPLDGHWNETGTNLAAIFLTEKIKLLLDEEITQN